MLRAARKVSSKRDYLLHQFKRGITVFDLWRIVPLAMTPPNMLSQNRVAEFDNRQHEGNADSRVRVKHAYYTVQALLNNTSHNFFNQVSYETRTRFRRFCEIVIRTIRIHW